MSQQEQQRHNRVALAIAAYFGSATVSLAWILLRARPPRERTWSTLVQDAASLWDTVPSELAVFVLLNFFVSALAMAAVLTAMLFLGRLSVTESQRLSHRLVKYAVFKTVFVGSIITPDTRDVAVWLAWFAVVGYLRVFLGAAKDRLESLLSSPGTQVGRHARGLCLLLLVLVHNAIAFFMVLRLLPGQPLARVLLCAFDSAVVTIEGLKTLLRYVVQMADRFQCLGGGGGGGGGGAYDGELPGGVAVTATGAVGGGGGGGWDVGWSGKGSFLYHAELVADMLVHGVTLVHYLHVWVLRGLSFHLTDAVLFLDIRAVFMSLLRRLRSHLSYRAATQRLNTTFKDVHPASLAAAGGGADCTICMDEIVHVAKQLPCGHVFHLSCLRAWLQQSGSESFTCPNCRKPILVGGRGDAAGGEGGEGEGGGQRRESNWWLVRTLDRLYLRLVMALEPLLLTLLLSITLWLGGRAQIRRRSPRSPPSPPREGFGESPVPAVLLPRGGVSSVFRTRGASDDDGNYEESPTSDISEGNTEEYSSDVDDVGHGGRYGDGGEEDEEVEGEGGLSDEEEGEEEAEPDAESDADSDAITGGERQRAGPLVRDAAEVDDGEGQEQLLPGAPRPQRRGGWRGAARRVCAALVGGHHGCGCPGTQPHSSPTPHPAPGAPHRPGSVDQLQPRASPYRLRSWEQRAAADGYPGGLAELLGGRTGAGAGPRRPGNDPRATGGPGPSAPSATRRRRGRVVRAPSPLPEVPSYSGDVLLPQAAAVAWRLGRTVSASLRSTCSAGGVCAGAVAWGGADTDEDDEVTSRRRRRHRPGRPSRAVSPQAGADRGDGAGGEARLGDRPGGRSRAARGPAGARAGGGAARRQLWED